MKFSEQCSDEDNPTSILSRNRQPTTVTFLAFILCIPSYLTLMKSFKCEIHFNSIYKTYRNTFSNNKISNIEGDFMDELAHLLHYITDLLNSKFSEPSKRTENHLFKKNCFLEISSLTKIPLEDISNQAFAVFIQHNTRSQTIIFRRGLKNNKISTPPELCLYLEIQPGQLSLPPPPAQTKCSAFSCGFDGGRFLRHSESE